MSKVKSVFPKFCGQSEVVAALAKESYKVFMTKEELHELVKELQEQTRRLDRWL